MEIAPVNADKRSLPITFGEAIQEILRVSYQQEKCDWLEDESDADHEKRK